MKLLAGVFVALSAGRALAANIIYTEVSVSRRYQLEWSTEACESRRAAAALIQGPFADPSPNAIRFPGQRSDLGLDLLVQGVVGLRSSSELTSTLSLLPIALYRSPL